MVANLDQVLHPDTELKMVNLKDMIARELCFRRSNQLAMAQAKETDTVMKADLVTQDKKKQCKT